ncbi:hypothetical protein LXA43DRAFT_720724 [Ganoderma leucocontextum]|nr:hypothetical protein LXA43DRAFT_720724 [Ganoderma leucocontextum]
MFCTCSSLLAHLIFSVPYPRLILYVCIAVASHRCISIGLSRSLVLWFLAGYTFGLVFTQTYGHSCS